MSEAARLSKAAILFAFAAALPLSAVYGAETVEFKKHKTSLSRDVFTQNFYYDSTQFLRFDRLYRKIFRKKERSRNVNLYDEVADSSFFTNRHSRSRMSLDELAKGFEDGFVMHQVTQNGERLFDCLLQGQRNRVAHAKAHSQMFSSDNFHAHSHW